MLDLRQLSEKKHWTQEDAAAAIASWRASGKSIAAFAKEQGLNDDRLRYWRDRVPDAAHRAGDALVKGPRLVRVDVADSAVPSAAAAGAWEVVTSRGRLRVHDGIGVAELRLVIEALVGSQVAP